MSHLAPWERHQPTGLEKQWCPSCQGHYTYALGRCTACIRKEENRKQGVLYLVAGGVLFLLSALALVFVRGIIFRMGAFASCVVALRIAWRGFRAVTTGISADGAY